MADRKRYRKCELDAIRYFIMESYRRADPSEHTLKGRPPREAPAKSGRTADPTAAAVEMAEREREWFKVWRTLAEGVLELMDFTARWVCVHVGRAEIGRMDRAAALSAAQTSPATRGPGNPAGR